MIPSEVKIVNKSNNPLPAYATEGSSGFDLRAHLSDNETLQPFERKLIPTGLFFEIPEGYEGQVRSRSGLAIHHGIACLNSPGTVDSDYRGEIKIILINLSQEVFTISPGDRIAQMVICKIEKVSLKPATELVATKRGEGGFGHSGTT